MPDKLSTNTEEHTTYKVGNCVVNFGTNRVLKNGREIKVEPKAIEVLSILIEANGETVGKDELIKRVWGEALVTENSLSQAISKLRKILENEKNGLQPIETISKKGYRLVASVETIYDKHNFGSASRINYKSDKLFKSVYAIVIIACLIVIGFFFNDVLFKKNTETGSSPRFLPLTSAPGIERLPSFFGNDSFIVFSKELSPIQSTIYIKDLNTGNETGLASSPGIKRYPKFLKSRNEFVYFGKTKETTAIFSVAISGGTEKAIAYVESGEVTGLDASANGDWIVYPDRKVEMASRSLFRQNIADKKTRRITNPPENYIGDKLPAISPDGSQIAFVRVDAERNEDIYLLENEIGNEHRITTHNLRIFGLDWSADGSEIVYFVSDPEGSAILMKMNLSDNSTKEIISSIEYIGTNPAVSGSNNKIAFESWKNSSNIYRISIHKDEITEPKAKTLIQSTRSDFKPQYSPDGKKISFISDRSGLPEVWLMDVDAKSFRKLSDIISTYRSSPPVWSHDGKYIAVDAKSKGVNKIYLIDAENGMTTKTVTGGISPYFSRDNNWLYYSSHQTGNWEIWKTNISSREKFQVTSNGGYLAKESFDGKHVYYSKLAQTGIWRQNIETKDEELVFEELAALDKYNWQVVENGIYFIRRMTNYKPVLFFHDFVKNESELIKEVVAIPHARTFGLSVSPDRRTVLFSQTNELDCDIMLMDYPR